MPASFSRWAGALLPRMVTVARCHLPGAPLDARRRELVSAAVAEAMGNAPLARVHEEWHRVLGPADMGEVDDEVLAWVLDAVAVEPHLDGDTMPGQVPEHARRAVVALVAHGVVAAATLDHLGSLVDQVLGRRPAQVRQAAADAVAVAVGAPLCGPPLAMALVASRLGRLAPGALEVEVPPDANLMTQLLAEILPNWFGSAWGRTLVSRLPVEVPVAVVSGATAATVRIGRGQMCIEDGVAEDVWAIFDGEVDALLRAGSDSLTREMRAAQLPS